MLRRSPAWTSTIVAATLVCTTAPLAAAQGYPGTHTLVTRYSYPVLLGRLRRAVKDQHMAVVAIASASQGAAARGVQIPGNAVVMVFRNDYAVRMLHDNVAAGIEAPLRIYVTENPNGKASLTYRTPSAVFAPYHDAKLNRLARQLDPVFQKIVGEAAGTQK